MSPDVGPQFALSVAALVVIPVAGVAVASALVIPAFLARRPDARSYYLKRVGQVFIGSLIAELVAFAAFVVS